MGTVKIIKFVSSQEVIARVIEESSTEIIVESPLTIQPLRSGETSMAIGLMPFTWAGDNKDTVALNRAHVLCVMNPEDELKTQYLAALAGLTIPNGAATPKLTLTEAR
jgi:hypothetical protein